MDDYLDDVIAIENSEGTLAFEVVKEHHRMSWLRQRRILRLTDVSVLNCKPKKAGRGETRVTKEIRYDTITAVAVDGATKFCLKVHGDHTYYYEAPNALQIALEVQKRVAANDAIAKILDSDGIASHVGEEDRRVLRQSFYSGQLQLPQYNDSTARKRGMTRVRAATLSASGSSLLLPAGRMQPSVGPPPPGMNSADISVAERDVFLTTLGLRLELHKAFRRGGVFSDVAAQARKLLGEYQDEAPELIALSELRESLNCLKESLLNSILQCAKEKRFDGLAEEIEEDVEFAPRIADDIIQEEVIAPAHALLWQSLTMQRDLIEQQRVVDQRRAALAQRDPSDFGVLDPLMRSMEFRFVSKLLQGLNHVTTPTKMLDQIVHVSKSIVLTIEAKTCVERHRANSVPGAGSQKSASSLKTLNLSADDVLPLFIKLLCNSPVNNLVFLREWIAKLADPMECSERTYYFTVFSSALEFILLSDGSGQASAPSSLGPVREAGGRTTVSSKGSAAVEVDSELDSLDDVQDDGISLPSTDHNDEEHQKKERETDAPEDISLESTSDVELPE